MNGGARRMRGAAALLAVASACLGLGACAPAPDGAGVEVLFPGAPDDAWGASAEVLRTELARDGHAVELRFAGDDIPTQLRQVQEALDRSPAVIVVAPVDVTALAAELAVHDDPEIVLISYERLVLDAPEVDVFAGFDHRECGRLQARALLAGLGLTDAVADARSGHAVELLAGSGDDPAALDTHAGALEVLTPFLDTGALVVPSGRVAFAQASILRGDPAIAADRIAELHDEGALLAGVIAPSDAMSTSVAEVIVERGGAVAPPAGALPGGGAPAEPEPPSAPPVVLVGGGASLAGVEAVLDGTRTATVYRDPARLARAVANMVREILRGSAPTVTRGALSDNGAAEVPTRLVGPLRVATREDARALLP